jgi:RimJ/RimL family protein N-acetyltransferase
MRRQRHRDQLQPLALREDGNKFRDVPEDQHMTQSTLYTERLQLVPLSDAHLELEIALDADPEVMRYLTGRSLSRAEVEHAHQRRIAAAREIPGLGFWAGFAAGDFVGWWILQPPHGPDQPKVAGEADLGYRLMRRHWRRGYASEGARELIRYGFDDLGLNRIFAQTMAANNPARATMSAAGLRHVRAFISGPYDELVPGAEQGEVEYEVTRSTWQRNRAADAPGVPQ